MRYVLGKYVLWLQTRVPLKRSTNWPKNCETVINWRYLLGGMRFSRALLHCKTFESARHKGMAACSSRSVLYLYENALGAND